MKRRYYNAEEHIRWMEYTLKHYDNTRNIYIGYSIATAAFIINLKLNINSISDDHYIDISIIIFVISVITGMVASIFKGNVYDGMRNHIAHNSDKKIDKKIIYKQKLSNRLLHLQILTYSAGCILLVLRVLYIL